MSEYVVVAVVMVVMTILWVVWLRTKTKSHVRSDSAPRLRARM